MIVLLHVVIAMLSIGMSSYAYVRPRVRTLRASYAFIGLTFLSGFYLIWTTPVSILRTCLSGIAYLTVVTTVTVLARRKLAAAAQSI